MSCILQSCCPNQCLKVCHEHKDVCKWLGDGGSQGEHDWCVPKGALVPSAVAVGITSVGDNGRPAWFVEWHLDGSDSSAMPVGPQTMGGRFLEDVLWGCAVDWADCCVLAREADCVLVALGLLHMRVKCVIPKELGGNYEPKVSTCGVVSCVVDVAVTAMSFAVR